MNIERVGKLAGQLVVNAEGPWREMGFEAAEIGRAMLIATITFVYRQRAKGVSHDEVASLLRDELEAQIRFHAERGDLANARPAGNA
jgi:hypothetical protein